MIHIFDGRARRRGASGRLAEFFRGLRVWIDFMDFGEFRQFAVDIRIVAGTSHPDCGGWPKYETKLHQ
jgi:hypothetical protein